MKYLIKYKTYENKITTSGNYGNYYIIHIDHKLDAKKFNIYVAIKKKNCYNEQDIERKRLILN